MLARLSARSTKRAIASSASSALTCERVAVQGIATSARARSHARDIASEGARGKERSVRRDARAARDARVGSAKRTFASSAEDEAKNAKDDDVVVDLDAKIKPQASAKVSAIADQVCELTLLEVNELCDVLAERLGLGDMSGMMFGGGMMPMGGGGGAVGGGGGGGAAAAAPVEEKTSFALKLESFDAAQKIKVIKEVRGITELGLKEAKDLVEGVPAVLKKDLKKEEAEELIAKLTAVGAKCVLE